MGGGSRIHQTILPHIGRDCVKLDCSVVTGRIPVFKLMLSWKIFILTQTFLVLAGDNGGDERGVLPAQAGTFIKLSNHWCTFVLCVSVQYSIQPFKFLRLAGRVCSRWQMSSHDPTSTFLNWFIIITRDGDTLHIQSVREIQMFG